MNELSMFIHYLSLLIYLIALIFVFRFYNQLKHEKYWIGFPITILCLLLHEIAEILHEVYLYDTEIFAEVFEITGAIVLIYSLFGLTKELTKINRSLSIDDLEE